MAWLGNRYITRTRKPSGSTSELEVVGVGGDFGYLPLAEVHEHILQNIFTYFARALGADDVLVHAEGAGRTRALYSDADRKQPNNLANLPDC